MINENLQNQIDFLLARAIQKCDNFEDAQDLTQETLLAAYIFLKKGGIIENLQAWLLKVMNHKYYDMLRYKYQYPTITIDESVDFVDQQDISFNLMKQEEAEILRREVAYLVNSYRVVITKYYFHNRSIKEIAQELHLPEGTIKSRLDFGRKQIKKGFDTMEHYTENSYLPQYLMVRNSGQFGMNEEPISLTEDDVLAQNILILAYEKPLTITQLSKAIGVASAYVEPVVAKLVNGELMKRMGDGKVYTDFILYQADDWIKYIKEQEEFVKTYAQHFFQPLQKAIQKLKQTSFYSLRLERFMLIQIAQAGLYESLKEIHQPQIFPERPNGGKWIAFGTIYPENYVISADKCGKEEYGMSGRRCTSIDHYLDAFNLKLYNFETSLDSFGYQKHSGYDYNNVQDVEFNMLKLFYLIKHHIKPESVDCDVKILKGIPLLEERGFLSSKDDKIQLLIPHLTHSQEVEFWDICQEAQKSFANHIQKPLWEYCKSHKKRIPTHLKSVPEQKLTLPYEPSAMMFVFEAINQGIHPRDLGYPCPETIAVFE